jgi:hypothetical protein
MSYHTSSGWRNGGCLSRFPDSRSRNPHEAVEPGAVPVRSRDHPGRVDAIRSRSQRGAGDVEGTTARLSVSRLVTMNPTRGNQLPKVELQLRHHAPCGRPTGSLIEPRCACRRTGGQWQLRILPSTWVGQALGDEFAEAQTFVQLAHENRNEGAPESFGFLSTPQWPPGCRFVIAA